MNPLTRLAILIGRQKWLPRFAPQIVAVDKWLQRVTRGRVTLAGLAGLPELVISVAGRKSGALRSTPLLYTPYQGSYLVAGTNWGGLKQPVWVLNLEASTEATVVVSSRTERVVTRIAEGEERARMWEAMLKVWPNYNVYAERTDREIKVFVLEPT